MPEGISTCIGLPVQPPPQFDKPAVQMAPSGGPPGLTRTCHVETQSGAAATFIWSVSETHRSAPQGQGRCARQA
jgi:hypothetical protein